MESMFKERDRMLAYAYALGVFKSTKHEEGEGICFYLRDFLEEYLGYNMNSFFHFRGNINFPELWKQRTKNIEDASDSWFKTHEERIEALENILKAK
jgi:hypothetical protein